MASGSTIQQTTVQTTSPVFKFTPICPSFPCFVNLTAKSMSNQSHTFMSVVSLNRQPLTIYLQHPVIVEAGVEFEIDVNCISSYTHETGCRVNLPDISSATNLSANSFITLNHSFSRHGLYTVNLEVLSSVSSRNYTSLIVVEEKISNLNIQVTL
ncbi:uncharacterized protein LOC144746870 [Ciona intestinalis]